MTRSVIEKIRKILKFVGRQGAIWLGLSVIAGVVLGASEIALSFLLTLLLGVLHITDQVPPLPFGLNASGLSLHLLLGLLVGCALLRGGFAWLGSQSAQVANDIISLRLKLLLFYEVFTIRTGFASISEINTKINETFGKGAAFCCQATGAIPSAIQVVLLLIFLLKQSLRETLIGIVGIGIIALILNQLNQSIRKVAARIPVEHAILSSRITRTVRNWFLLKALRTMEQEYRSICANTIAYSSHSIRASAFIVITGVLPQMLGTVVIAVLILVHSGHPQMSNIGFIAFIYLYMRFVQTLSGLAGYQGAMTLYFPQFKEAARYFFTFSPETISRAMLPRQRPQINENIPLTENHPSDLKQTSTPPSIRLKNVSFRYPGQSQDAIHSVSLAVEPGEQVAILGPSGAGKSTILALIMGVFEQDSGTIEIQNQKPADYFGQAGRRFGYVGAEPFLIEGTIRENLLYGIKLNKDDNALFHAIELAQLGPWINGLQKGLDYPISENGEGLSSGQKQRLSLARAFLMEPDFLLLDEISANLDTKTETEIARVIESLKGKCTTLVVSHRVGLIQNIKNRVELG